MSNSTTAQNASGDQNFDYMFKLLIIGNSSVGKTSFLFRYCDDSFTSAFVSPQTFMGTANAVVPVENVNVPEALT